VTTASCCRSADDFPNSCLEGACGCAPDSSHDVQLCTCPADACFDGLECVLRSPTAYLLWTSPGGAAGTGPAMELLEDGTLRLWHAGRSLSPRTTSDWDLELVLTAEQNRELVQLILDVDDSNLPHDGPWAECYPSLYFVASDGTTLDFGFANADALSPEFDAVYAWLQAYFAANAPDYAGPWQYCLFGG
jgi:hypothetical protein